MTLLSKLTFFCLLTGSGLWAFQAPDGPPSAEAWAPPAFVPMLVDEAVPEPPEETVGRFFFVGESVDQVLVFLSELTGKRILSPEALPGAAISFDSQGPMKKSEAIVAIESLLNLNGIAVAEMGESFIRVLPSNMVRFKSPDIIEGSVQGLSPSERVYAKVFEFRFLKMEEAMTLVGNLLTQGTGYVEPLKSKNGCMVTDSLVNLQRVERLLSQLDSPSDHEMIIRKLNYMAALDMQRKLRESIDGPLRAFFEGNIGVDADERTNQVVIVTSPVNRSMLEHLIDTFDSDSEPLTINEVVYLKHAEADKVVAIIDSIISGQNKQSDRNRKTPVVPVPGGDPKAPAGEGAAASASTAGASADGTGTLQFSPYVTVVADERSNAVLAYGTRPDVRSVKEIIANLDVLLPQVRIDVVITEVTLTNENSRGIERFGVAYDENDEITFQVNENSDLPIRFEGSLTDVILRSLTIKDFTLATVFDTASKDSNVRVISAPTLVTTHNREAVINAGESRPVITSSNTDSTGLSTRSQVQFKDIGVQLKVKPLIGSNGMVQMEIQQTVENVVDEVTIDGNSQPVIGKREATSFVSVSSGEVVVLGGLQEKTMRDSEGKLGFFGSIPVVGRLLFSNDRKTQTTRELIIFIKPTVFIQAGDAERSGAVIYSGLDDKTRTNVDQVLGEEPSNIGPAEPDAADDGAGRVEGPIPVRRGGGVHRRW
ncbi:MAG: hypothetical protein JW706_02205 [Opitutales bacterium]|nr:hypothetical protein [Opitutales bacterium]